ncbi:PQQ-dependent sugar dehydrogenase [Mycolicibacterium smegmatis]|uniref:PQQ-dependent sugar dehydrogenase n=1 Tax=Mycolicibacterium smegmatis TaxID=1772 RepID=UPI00157A4D88|nr:PQQ-dependent sugar dehydrogenase [Mycolicibacterium smegmatis]MDF1898699.1 PQQ-dependent sugar dehydrogenase [Mycolicibacterium smegmatis]MDF1917310.1 PQQ-dependent sugar dehydrogenase [Mycolicibacterium smegmatis]MDF1924850.1 PQQ-dependent sugar dehydrogenase [Mycolicibacterium smegmatis]UAK54435.1 PQQ-dependent sugar dehydrogenase [Mycolicibacterium smegmatis]UGT76839.1 PQQ-dependent sugar dehydrogenase [Mycolicibacterium smegmatis]
MKSLRRMRQVAAVLCAAMLVGTGCARFDAAQSEPFTTEPELRPGPTTTPPPPPPLPAVPFPKECPAPGVMQGCLDSTSGLIMGADSQSALVGERLTGAIKEVATRAEPKIKTVIPVDPSGDGGLMDIVKSPTYIQDRLMYAYISTPTDNRVVRIADGDVPKPILTGIPKGATGNMGSLIFTSPTTLLVQTGDAGDPAMAADPNSPAGKVLRIEQPTTVNQAPITTAMSGMGAGGGMCIDPSDGSLYVTDRTPTADRLQRMTKDSKISTVWTWPDRPGVAGCAALDGTVLVNLVDTKKTVAVHMAPDTGAVTGEPEVVRDNTRGHVWALQLSPDGNVWGATVNKTAGDAEKLDDVVFPLFPQGGGFPRGDADKT